jgi:hypothetical protein
MSMTGKPYVPALTPGAIKERQSWQYQAIAYLHGGKSQLGALTLAIMGRKIRAPCFSPAGAKITKDGQVVALYKRSDTEHWRPERVYDDVAAFVDVFRGLADALKLDDVQRELMFNEIRKFIVTDERANSGEPLI